MTLSLATQLGASFITMLSMWAYGNKSRWGAIFGLAGEVPWLAIMILNDMWGLLPLNALMFVIHARNLWKMK